MLSVFSFHTSISHADTAFTKLTPLNGAGGLGTSVTLTWNAPSADVGYYVCVDSKQNDSCDTYWQANFWQPTGAATSKVFSNLASGTYYWQVITTSGINADNGTWYTFTVGGPVLKPEKIPAPAPCPIIIKDGVAQEVCPKKNLPTTGWVDGITSDGVITGWALDPDHLDLPIDVHIYFDTGAKKGATPLSVRTDVQRDDVNTNLKATGKHGFNFKIPDNYRDSKNHFIYAYGIDRDDLTGNANTELQGTTDKKVFTLKPDSIALPSPCPMTVVNGVAQEVCPIQPAITVISPNGGEQLTAGKPFTITWKRNWIPTGANGLVKIAYRQTYRGTDYDTIIAGSAMDTSGYTWNIPATLASGSYKIVITTEGTGGTDKRPLFDASDAVFNIVAPPVGQTAVLPCTGDDPAPLKLLADNRSDGKLYSQCGKIYVIEFSKKRWINSPPVFSGLGYKLSNVRHVNVTNIPDGNDITTAQQRHTRGTLVRFGNLPAVWFIGSTARYLFPNEAIFFAWGNLFAEVIQGNSFDQALPIGAPVTLPDRAVGPINNYSSNSVSKPTNLKDGQLYITQDNSLWVISNMQKRKFASRDIFNKMGYKLSNTIPAPANFVDVPLGPPITSADERHPAGTVVKQFYPGLPSLVLMGADSMMPFPTKKVFDCLGYKDKDVIADLEGTAITQSDFRVSLGPLMEAPADCPLIRNYDSLVREMLATDDLNTVMNRAVSAGLIVEHYFPDDDTEPQFYLVRHPDTQQVVFTASIQEAIGSISANLQNTNATCKDPNGINAIVMSAGKPYALRTLRNKIHLQYDPHQPSLTIDLYAAAQLAVDSLDNALLGYNGGPTDNIPRFTMTDDKSAASILLTVMPNGFFDRKNQNGKYISNPNAIMDASIRRGNVNGEVFEYGSIRINQDMLKKYGYGTDDLKFMILHELGHLLGLDHSKADRNSFIFPSFEKGDRHPIQNYDILALRHIHDRDVRNQVSLTDCKAWVDQTNRVEPPPPPPPGWDPDNYSLPPWDASQFWFYYSTQGYINNYYQYYYGHVTARCIGCG